MSLTAADVVITGIGCVSPLGPDRETTWRRLLAGEAGVRQLTPDDFHGLLGVDRGVPMVGAPAMCGEERSEGEPVLQLLAVAANEAVSHARLEPGSFVPDRAGSVIGTSKGGIVAFARAFDARRKRFPFDLGAFPTNVAASHAAAKFGLRGPCLAPVAACATGLVCVLRGAELISEGVCDVVIAGSGDASLHPAVLASFGRMGVLSRRTEQPCRPFNADRDGFVVGEGAAVFVLERRSHAENRGALPLATVHGGAVLSDPAGVTSVDLRGATLSRAIGDTLDRAGLSNANVGHINLHGTATRSNDVAEAAGLRGALGKTVDYVPCVALKGAIGHLLGGAGAVELAATVLAIRDGRLPPTPSFTNPDSECLLPLSRSATPVGGCGLKISLGFGGHVAVACLGPA